MQKLAKDGSGQVHVIPIQTKNGAKAKLPATIPSIGISTFIRRLK
jgi:hypothetical protein